LDLSAHFAQYKHTDGDNSEDTDGVGVEFKNIHFASLLSFMHVRLGALITSVESAVVSGDAGSKRKSITSHLSIFIL
jgi:hypothetical protein